MTKKTITLSEFKLLGAQEKMDLMLGGFELIDDSPSIVDVSIPDHCTCNKEIEMHPCTFEANVNNNLDCVCTCCDYCEKLCHENI